MCLHVRNGEFSMSSKDITKKKKKNVHNDTTLTTPPHEVQKPHHNFQTLHSEVKIMKIRIQPYFHINYQSWLHTALDVFV